MATLKAETRGRKKLPKGEKRSEFLAVMLTPSEKAAVVAKAAPAPVSSWARDLILSVIVAC